MPNPDRSSDTLVAIRQCIIQMLCFATPIICESSDTWIPRNIPSLHTCFQWTYNIIQIESQLPILASNQQQHLSLGFSFYLLPNVLCILEPTHNPFLWLKKGYLPFRPGWITIFLLVQSVWFQWESYTESQICKPLSWASLNNRLLQCCYGVVCDSCCKFPRYLDSIVVFLLLHFYSTIFIWKKLRHQTYVIFLPLTLTKKIPVKCVGLSKLLLLSIF